MTRFLPRKISRAWFRAALIAAAGIAFAPTAPAEEAGLSMDACIQRAITHHAGLLANQHDINAAKAGIKKAEADLLPNLTGLAEAETFMGKPTSPFSLATLSPLNTASLPTPTFLNTTVKTVVTDHTKTVTSKGARGGAHQTITSSAGAVTSTTTTVHTNVTQPRIPMVRGLQYPIFAQTSAQLNYPIFASGSFLGLNHPPTVAYARAVLEQQVSSGQLTKATLISTVENAYITIDWAESQARLDRQIIVGLNELLRITSEEVRLRVDLPTNEAALRQEILAATTHLADTETLLNAARLQLSRLIGASAPGAVKIQPVNTVTVPAIGDLYAKVVGRHPQVQVQESTKEEAYQLYRVAKSAQWPTVSMQSTWALGDDFDHGEQDLWSAGFLVSVPIFDFGSRSDAARQAHETWLAESARTTQAKDDVFNAMATAYANIHEYEIGVVSADRQIADIQANLNVLEAQQAQGILKPAPVWQTRIQLLGLKELRGVNRYKMLVWYAALRRAAGGNWKWCQ